LSPPRPRCGPPRGGAVFATVVNAASTESAGALTGRSDPRQASRLARAQNYATIRIVHEQYPRGAWARPGSVGPRSPGSALLLAREPRRPPCRQGCRNVRKAATTSGRDCRRASLLADKPSSPQLTLEHDRPLAEPSAGEQLFAATAALSFDRRSSAAHDSIDSAGESPVPASDLPARDDAAPSRPDRTRSQSLSDPKTTT
jgi:hypothetical protein